jgi:hypothetical protein
MKTLVTLALPALLAAPANAQVQLRLGSAVGGTTTSAWRVPHGASPLPAPALPVARSADAGAALGGRVLLGSVGSALGLWAGALATVRLTGCVEFGCIGLAVLGGGVGSVAGTVLGVEAAGAITGTRTDTFSTVVGSTLGLVAGALVGGAIASTTSSPSSGGAAVIGFSLTQGTLAAMASVQN